MQEIRCSAHPKVGQDKNKPSECRKGHEEHPSSQRHDGVPESSVEWVLLPHETLAWLQTACPRMFSIHAGAKEGGVQDWWEGLRSSQSGKELWSLHPWLQRRTPQDLKFHVALMMFDDAGSISNISSNYVWVFYSLLGVGSDK